MNNILLSLHLQQYLETLLYKPRRERKKVRNAYNRIMIKQMYIYLKETGSILPRHKRGSSIDQILLSSSILLCKLHYKKLWQQLFDADLAPTQLNLC
jgi:hypothetical protein